MKKSILTFVFFVALLLVSFTNAQCQSESEIKAKIEKLNAKFIDAMMKGDFSIVADYFEKDAVSLPSYSPMLVGREAIKQANEASANSGVKYKTFEISTEKLIMSGDLIVEIGKFNMSMEIPMMDEPYNEVGKYITVWKKQKDGSLKIATEMWNSNQNPGM